MTLHGRRGRLPYGTPTAPMPRLFVRPPPAKAPAWKRHAKDLYDCLAIWTFEAPVSCSEWLPWCTRGGGEYYSRTLLVGTDANHEIVPSIVEKPVVWRGTRDYLCLIDVNLPAEEVAPEDDELFLGAPKIQMSRKVNHAGPVTALGHSPLNPDFVATGTMLGNICVFNVQGFRCQPPEDDRCKPEAELVAHEGRCMDVTWSPHENHILLSAALDGGLCLWDIGAKRSAGRLLQPLSSLPGAHRDLPAHCVAFHPASKSLLASCGGDGRLCIWDTRTKWENTDKNNAVASVNAHVGTCKTLAFAPSPANHAVLATGGQDKQLRIWDLRCLGSALQTLSGHRGPVEKVVWSAACEAFGGDNGTNRLGGTHFLASCGSGNDKRVLLWDPRHCGSVASQRCSENHFAPELSFIHDAHAAAVTSVAWAPATDVAKDLIGRQPPLLASADAAGKFHFWCPAMDVLLEDERRLR